jgi:hypothetical protein
MAKKSKSRPSTRSAKDKDAQWGSTDAMAELNNARDTALREIG